MHPTSADPTGMETSKKIYQGTCQRDPICPKTNYRHNKNMKHYHADRTEKRKPYEQKQAPQKNPRIRRLDKGKTLPPSTDTNNIWRAQGVRIRNYICAEKRGEESDRAKIRPRRNNRQYTGEMAGDKNRKKKQADYKNQPTRKIRNRYGHTNADYAQILTPRTLP